MGCASCEEQKGLGHKFCNECGARLSEAKANVPVERRQLTVLFYDLVGSTELSGKCDPEDFRETIQKFHAAVTKAVQPFQAFVGAHVGDGGIVYFGYPIAREDAAECAILAGLALAKAVTSLTLPDGRMAQARTGIATGTGVVGRIEDGDTGNSAVGAVTSLAARLQGQCNPGQVVISDTTRRLVGKLFELEDLGHVEAKGFAGGARAWRVDKRSALDRFEALHDGSNRLIGRKAERKRLTQIWQDASEGGSQVAVINAEAGVGKSRFALEFSREVGRDGANRITVFCTPQSQRSALRPFITYLNRMASRAAQSGAPTLEALRTVLSADTREADYAVIAQLMGLDPPMPEALVGLTAPQLLDATIDALIDQVELWSREIPVVLLFEDLHWADPTSLTLIERILSGRNIGHTMMMLTTRPVETSVDIGLDRAEHLQLEPFSAEDARALIDGILGGRAADSLIDAIVTRAGGVPLFIEELTRAVLDTDAYVHRDSSDSYELSENVVLPETLQDSLLARLDALGPVKRVAQFASVVGREFPVSILEDLFDEPIPDVVGGCSTLEDAGMIVPLRQDSGDQFLFRHVLIQEFAYSTLVKTDRRKLNGKLLDLLEAAEASGAIIDPERLAHYAEEAGRTATAVHYWHLAGVQALIQSAMPEAESRLRAGLSLIPEIEDDGERTRLELEFRLALGKVLMAVQGHAATEIGEIFERANTLAKRTGDQAKILATLHGQQAHDLQHSRMRSARNRSAEMLALAEEGQDDLWRLVGYRSRGIASFPLGEYRQSADDLGIGMELARKVDLQAIKQIVVDDIEVAMGVYRSWSLIFLGQNDQAKSAYLAALERSEQIDQPYTKAFAQIGRIHAMLLMDDLEEFEASLASTYAICEEFDIPYFAASAHMFEGVYQAKTGQKKAVDTLHNGLEQFRKTGSILYVPTHLHWLGLAQLDQGQLDGARQSNAESIEIAEKHDMHHMMAEFRGLKAVLAQLDGDGDAAETAFNSAKSVTDDQSSARSDRLNRELWARYELRCAAGELQS